MKNDSLLCAVCEKPLDNDMKIVTLTEKGATTFNKASSERKNCLRVNVKQTLHTKCRQQWINKKKLQCCKKQ